MDANFLLAFLGRDEEGKLLQFEALSWVLFRQHLFRRGPLNQLSVSGPLTVVRRRGCQLPDAADSRLHLVRPGLGLCDACIQEEVFVIDFRFALLDLFLCLLLQQIRLVYSLLRYFHRLTLSPDSDQLFALPLKGGELQLGGRLHDLVELVQHPLASLVEGGYLLFEEVQIILLKLVFFVILAETLLEELLIDIFRQILEQILSVLLDPIEVVAVFGDKCIELGPFEILHFKARLEVGDGRHGARSRLDVDRIG